MQYGIYEESDASRSLHWERGLKRSIPARRASSAKRRSLHWERGLKHDGFDSHAEKPYVAPFIGSVD